MTKKFEEEILEKLDIAELSHNPRDFQAVIDFLVAQKEKLAGDPLYNYYIGFSYLYMPDNERYLKDAAYENLSKALALDPGNLNSQYHLTFCYYHFGQLGNVERSCLELIPQLTEEGNMKAALVLSEYLLCAQLKMRHYSKYAANFRTWVSAYRTNIPRDERALPRELIITTAKFFKAYNDRFSEETKKYFESISKDLLSLFLDFPKSQLNYRDEIQALRDWNGKESGNYHLQYA